MSKIKLTGESSGYVEISAGSNAGNNTLELPTSGTRLVASDSDGNVTIGGTLTYADVTNVDSIGIVTARSGIHIGTGTSITSPSDNVLTLGTNNTEKVRITSAGQVKITGVDDQDNLLVNGGNSQFAVHQDDSDGEVSLRAQDGSGSNSTKYMTFFTEGGSGPTERLRILSGGTIGIGSITSTIPVTPPTDVLDGNVPELSSVLKIHRNNAHVSAGTSIGLLISDRVNRGTDAFSPLVLENAHDGNTDYGGPIIKGRRYDHGGYDGTGFEINVGNGDGLCNIVAGAHYNPTDNKYSFDGYRGCAMIKLTDTTTQGVVRLFGSEGMGDPGIGVTMLQHYPPPTFYAHSASVTLNNNVITKITYATEVFDTHTAYDTSTGKFTAPMSGYYWMHATLRIAAMASNGRYDITFRINGSASVYSGGLNQQNSNDASTMATVIMDLNKGDEVEVYAEQNGGGNEPAGNSSNAGGTGMSHFTGYLVAPKF